MSFTNAMFLLDSNLLHVQPNYTAIVINYLNGVYHVHVKQYKQIDLCV